MAGLARRFANDIRGATALMFGLMLGILFITIGVALDTARLYSLSDKVRNALDAAALAGAKLLDVETATDSDVTERARAFFETYRANMQLSDASFGQPSVVTNRTDATVTVSVDVDYRTLFGQLMSVTNIKFTPSATVAFQTKKVELALVLDVTGSMGLNGRLSGMKSAANDILDALVSNNPEPGAVRVGLVPYSGAVNVGAYFPSVANTAGATDTCVVERNGLSQTTDDPPSMQLFVSGSVVPAATAPVASNSYFCPTAGITPLLDISSTTNLTHLRNAIQALDANGWTSGHIGAAWGWYMVSPRWTPIWPSDSDPRPYANNVVKAVLLLTDGEFNTSYVPHADGAVRTSTDPLVANSSAWQALELCRNMRHAGIRVYTVGFETNLAADSLLQECASDPSNFFSAQNASQLRDAFRVIAQRLSSLRLSK